jgi:HAD superfamily hydrolase (TIGR01509 family)
LTTFLPTYDFRPVITREFKPPKPHPHGILHIAKEWNIKPENLIMVGDSIDDMQAGYRAGAATILLESDVNKHVKDAPETDVSIAR